MCRFWEFSGFTKIRLGFGLSEEKYANHWESNIIKVLGYWLWSVCNPLITLILIEVCGMLRLTSIGSE